LYVEVACVVEDGDTGAIVTPVLEAAQAFEEQRSRRPPAQITHDAAHVGFPSLLLGAGLPEDRQWERL
jgi:hypothetical protein